MSEKFYLVTVPIVVARSFLVTAVDDDAAIAAVINTGPGGPEHALKVDTNITFLRNNSDKVEVSVSLLTDLKKAEDVVPPGTVFS